MRIESSQPHSVTGIKKDTHEVSGVKDFKGFNEFLGSRMRARDV